MLDEDVGDGDITSLSVIPKKATLEAALVAREGIVVAGLPVALAVFRRLVPDVQFDVQARDGDIVRANGTIVTVSGQARGLLTAERSALNVLQHLSGIATMTHRYAVAIENTSAKLLDTRKTIPGLRRYAKYAAMMGGAHNHRMGLYDAILIKDNHIAIAGGIAQAIKAARTTKQFIEIECDTLDQVEAALREGVRPHPAGQYDHGHDARGRPPCRRHRTGSLGQRDAGIHPGDRADRCNLHLRRPDHDVIAGGRYRDGFQRLADERDDRLYTCCPPLIMISAPVT